jgi:MerR family transcriptional regulator, heat shock protein HspR
MARGASDRAPRGSATQSTPPDGISPSGGRGPSRGSDGGVSLRGDLQRPRYFISIAAELASVHPRTLRIYEEEGLLCPQRRNNLRLYSEADIRRVRIIRFLTRRQGVNLAGVKVILQLEALGKIRVFDLFDEADVERYVEGDEPEPVSDLDRRDM